MARYAHGCISVDCAAVVRIGNTTEETNCDFYFESDKPAECGRAARAHHKETGHAIEGIVGTAVFSFQEA